MADFLAQPMMQRILLAALLASIASGVVGAFVVVRRMSSITGGLAHAAFGGVGLGFLIGIPPMLGAAGFGLLAALGVGILYRRYGSALDTGVSIFWSLGMALGVIFIAMSDGYAPDLTSYLFGSILFVTWDYIAIVAVVDVILVAATWRFYRWFEAVCFDEEFAAAAGAPVDALLLALLAMIALAVVTLIRVVGIILAIALLTIPAEIARGRATNLSGVMVGGSVIAAACSVGGVVGSYALATAGWSVPSGPLIIVFTVGLYAVAKATQR